ncbi:MAG: phosphate ABC transporter permease PstA [Planctomycetota bacterium]
MDERQDTPPAELAPKLEVQGLPTAPAQRVGGRRRRASSLFARGETMVWTTGGALVLCLLMVIGLLVLVVVKGMGTFWPEHVVQMKLADGSVWGGEIWDKETFTLSYDSLRALPQAEQKRAREAAEKDAEFVSAVRQARARVTAEGPKELAAWLDADPTTLSADQQTARTEALEAIDRDAFQAAPPTLERTKLRMGNYELLGEHFKWLPAQEVVETTEPEWVIAVERLEWGRFFGTPVAFLEGEEKTAETPEAAWKRFEAVFPEVEERREAIKDLERDDLGDLNHEEKEAQLDVKQAAIDHGAGSPEHKKAQEAFEALKASLQPKRDVIEAKIAELRTKNATYRFLMQVADGREVELSADKVVRAYPANQLGFGGKVGVYLSRWWEFLAGEPREANSEGGVWPAIFGTIVMTLLMTLLVVPFGVLAALYLREYAKQGFLISLVRVAVGNLAGVPSIVFGVFGLGFFCYLMGGFIDNTFFEAKLPLPTYGTGGLLWASLTLALLTLPVVVVATEEALAAVPNSMREGSYAAGASKWQTIRRIVLPQAAPGIMTGMILAIARGAGEVAPLMLVGAVKLAPELPVDGTVPFIHPERSFMHLGFHIFDLGFQSQNSEAARPMVYTTTLLLIGIVVILNVVAIKIRSRLRRAKEA